MQKRVLRILGIVLIVVGVLFILNIPSITGFIVVQDIKDNTARILGLALIFVGILMFLAKKYSEEWRHATARKRLIDLLEGKQENVESEPAFNIMDRYDHVRRVGTMTINERIYDKYEGEIKGEYGGGKEIFTVDRQEGFDLQLPKGRSVKMPSHVDVQLGGENHRRENIPWRKFLEENRDVLKKYDITPDKMLEKLEHEGDDR